MWRVTVEPDSGHVMGAMHCAALSHLIYAVYSCVSWSHWIAMVPLLQKVRGQSTYTGNTARRSLPTWHFHLSGTWMDERHEVSGHGEKGEHWWKRLVRDTGRGLFQNITTGWISPRWRIRQVRLNRTGAQNRCSVISKKIVTNWKNNQQ